MATTTGRRLKHWGWGFEDQQPSHEDVQAAATGAREHLGFEPADVERPVPLERVELPPPRLEPPASLEPDLPPGPLRARRPRLRQVLPRRGARLPRALRPPAGRGGAPARRGRARGGAGLVRRGGRRGDPVRRRHQRGGRRGASAAGRLRRCGHGGPEGAGPRARGRSGLARGAHPGRRHRPGPRGPAARARPDPPPLPAVVRVLHARRLGGHARRRPLRHARHPHRRSRGVGAGDHAARRVGEPAAARARAPGRARTGC